MIVDDGGVVKDALLEKPRRGADGLDVTGLANGGIGMGIGGGKVRIAHRSLPEPFLASCAVLTSRFKIPYFILAIAKATQASSSVLYVPT